MSRMADLKKNNVTHMADLSADDNEDKIKT